MITTPTLTAAQVTRAVTVLSHPGLIRLVTEIDDYGPVNRRMLGRTFADLMRHQIRHALDIGRAHQLVRTGHRSEPCYLLTGRDTDLADVYDTVARWARTQQFPTPASDFVTRVQQTLTLLSHESVLGLMTGETSDPQPSRQIMDAGLFPNTDAVTSLHWPWAAVSAWIRSNPSVLTARTRRSTVATVEAERAR
ncbi:hypothetical protein [Streptomyces sp. UNOB3_S3]|uniref:hypothetical protein n=1 Tax=Streptomyces sp. UNOB3_S3 TaxID=2871682 RepID=UPI001E282EE5|nr:hypothetical protein [Streptomyces sp. UNOB3_S3]MCC3775873.1 hypothetical protein [Streptomyces sp. UNOB3_S3]